MRVLVVGDIHLKPAIFDRAEKILESGQADIAIQMGDLVDDWGCGLMLDLYERTLKRAIQFNKEHPGTVWIMGNHDYAYINSSYGPRESGHSKMAEPVAAPLLSRLPQKIIHVVDNVIFTHAGLTKEWVDRQKMLVGLTPSESLNKGQLETLVNFAAPTELWQENSPIWARPQIDDYEMYPAKLQVVGHTPVKTATYDKNILSTDVFSMNSKGFPIGDERFVIADTEKGEWKYVDED